MDSSSEADRVVQSVVSPSLLDGLLDANLSDWLPQSQWELGIEEFDTPPVLNPQTLEESDELLLLASQQYESEFVDDGGAQAGSASGSTGRRFGVPVSSAVVEQSRKSGVPPKTRGQTTWCCRVWAAWVKDRKFLPEADLEEANHGLSEDIAKMSITSLQFWLPKFVLEVRRADQQHYPPDSLYSLCTGLQRSLKFNDRAEVRLFSDCKFSRFQSTLDSEMKRLRSMGKYKKKKAEVIGTEQEDILWKKGLLGDHCPQALLDTLVYYIGLYFAIRGGEHRQLRFKPSQLELVEPANASPYLVFTEFVSKTNQGGLLHRKKQPKQVTHHVNVESSDRCLVRMFKLYNSRCPADRPDDAFYLRPLSRPKGDVWYQRSPVGHNTLGSTIPRLFKAAGISGHFTNHSLRATSATRMFDAGLDEQLIMSCTGHSSTGGVRSYKRVTEQLQEKTSKILNARPQMTSTETMHEMKPSTESMTSDQSDNSQKENADQAKSKVPDISFVGATNFTVNFNF